MKNWKHKIRRLSALIMAVLLFAGSVDYTVFAAETATANLTVLDSSTKDGQTPHSDSQNTESTEEKSQEAGAAQDNDSETNQTEESSTNPPVNEDEADKAGIDEDETGSLPDGDNSSEINTPADDNSDQTNTPADDDSDETNTPADETTTPDGDNSDETNTPDDDDFDEINTPDGNNSSETNTPANDNSNETNVPADDNSAEETDPAINDGVLTDSETEKPGQENDVPKDDLLLQQNTDNAETENPKIQIIEEFIDLGDTLTSVPAGISFFSLDNGTVDLKSGSYVKWIDRLDLPDYALKFYQALEEAVDNDGKDDFLINDDYFSKKPAEIFEQETYAIPFMCYPVTSSSNFNKESEYVSKCMRAAYDAFDRDHPEVFWLSGRTSAATATRYDSQSGKSYFYFYFILKREENNFDIRSRTYPNQAAIRSAIQERENWISRVLSSVQSSTDDKSRIRALNNWLTKNNEYNTDLAGAKAGYPDAWECVSALEGRTGTEGPVCEGYARAFKVLCDRLNIPCVLVDGDAISSSGPGAHMWNYVELNDNWYAADVTWNDPTVYGISGAVSGRETDIWLLLCSDSVVNGRTFIDSHPISNGASVGGVNFINGPQLATTADAAKSSIVNAAVTLASDNYIYNGMPHNPAVTVTLEGKTLSQDTDYTVSYENNINAGTAAVTITAKGNYKGTLTKDFSIAKAANAITLPKTAYAYSASSSSTRTFSIGATAKSGTVSYKSSSSSVTVDKTGKVTIPKNFSGKATITVSAPENTNYNTAAARTVTVQVNQISNTITAPNFTKTASAAAQSFSIGTKRLGSGRITYSSSNRSITVDSAGKVTIAKNFVGKATITIKVAASGIYKETVKNITVTVNKAAGKITASNFTKTASAAAQSFSINAQRSGSGRITYSSNNRSVAVDSTGKVTIAKNFVGKAAITIKVAASGIYEAASRTITVTVNQASSKITASNFTKTASSKTQSFSIGAKRSGSGKITYSSNNKSVAVNSSGKVTIAKNFVGKATITIKVAASGIYKATSKTITVSVNPANTYISSVKNSGSRKMTVTWKKSTAVTGYQIQYSTSRSFKTGVKTTTVSKNSTVSAAMSSLTKGKTYYVRIRTYRTVSGTKYYSGWSSSKTVKITR